METAQYLDDLLARMMDKTPFTRSDDSVSFQAHREAEKLGDEELLDVAISRCAAERDKKIRDRLYFVIGKLGLNTGRGDAVRFLIKQLNAETDKYVLSSMLDRIAELPKGEDHDLTAIIECVADKRWQVRHSAIMALDRTKSERAEALLIEILVRSEDPYELGYSNAVLGRIGSSRAIPALKPLCWHKTEDVACPAVNAISEIAGKDELPLFVEILERGKWGTKAVAMDAIEKHGDSSAIEAVLNRVKRILSRRRKIEQLPRSDLIQGLTFLYRYRNEDHRIAKLFEKTLPKKTEFLFDREREQLKELVQQEE